MSCELTPQARAFSTVLTAFVGSIVNGLSSGFLVAFITGWISWFACLRILSGALISLYQGFSSDHTPLPTALPNDEAIELEQRGLISETAAQAPGLGASQQVGDKTTWSDKRIVRNVTFLGWIGWIYTAIYSPIVQILWLIENWSAASGELKIVRGLGISVSALGLTIDTKKRYATKLRDSGPACIGNSACVAFKLINAGSAFGLGLMCAALLVKAAIDLKLQWFIIVIYCVFMVIWTAGSYSFTPPRDGGIKGAGIIPDILMGAFAGIFLAAPAFAVMQTAEEPTLTSDGFSYPDSGGTSLRSYLSCESVAIWQKMAAVLP